MRRTEVASERDSSFLFKLVFYVCIPALEFYSLSTVELTRHLLVFSLLATFLYVFGFLVGGRLYSPGRTWSS